MKILQISNYFYPHIGGIEQVARDIANALKGEYEQKIFCFNSEKNDSTDTVDEVEIVRAGSFVKVASQSLSFRYGKLLRKTIDEFKPDVIIFHYPNPFGAHYLLKILKKYSNIKLVLYWHLDIFKQKFLKLFFKGQTKRLCARATKIVATSPNYIEGSKYLSDNLEKCVVVPNCVYTDKFVFNDNVKRFVDSVRESNKGKKILFAVGRHVPYKGLEYLIKASGYLGNDYVIYIGGSGPLTENLKKIAIGDDKIHFLGRVPDDELVGWYYACDVFCFPSITKNEAFGISLAEAMFCGKPAVTFTIAGSGVNYVNLDKVTGLEVENRNVKDFAKAIEIIANDEELKSKYEKNAKDRVEKLFTFDKFKNNIHNLIEKI